MTSKIGLRMAWLFAGAVAFALGGRPLSAQESSDSPSAEAAEQRDADQQKLDDLERRYAADDIPAFNRLAAASLSQRECVHCHFKVPKSGEAASLGYWAAGLRLIAAGAECAKCHDAGGKQEAAAAKGDCPGLNPHCRRNAEKRTMTTYLGVSTSPVPVVLRRHLKLPSEIGLLVEGVETDSPAASAGVAQYDVLEKFDSQWLVNQEQFSILVRLHHSGDEVALEVVREGQPKTLAAKLGQREASAEADSLADLETAMLTESRKMMYEAVYRDRVGVLRGRSAAHPAKDADNGKQQAAEPPTVAYLGVGTSAPPAAMTAQLKLPAGLYLLVDQVEPESPAAAAGIEPGDVLQKFDDQLLVNSEQFSVLVRNRQPGEEVQIAAIRQGKPVVLRA
ncbi:MAG TPA: PDZ domain-containing protein, partial [Pirellulales bacterium]|nr:PDZ domain-containing protein [Pirellulales bacterium]